MRIRLPQFAIILGLCITALYAQTGPAGQQLPLLGFDPDGSSRERALEKQFDSVIKKDDLRDWMKRLSARPHHLGSAYDKENAEHREPLSFLGLRYCDRKIRRTFPYAEDADPGNDLSTKIYRKARRARTPGRHHFRAKIRTVPVYNAYSINGDVTGELVYANYGNQQDYEELARRGIDVRGEIVIVRYGNSFRGVKPKIAAEHGAIGCIIYSDPRDDGYFAGDVYPQGAWRNETGAQRGSVADLPLYSGDPLTPGVGATPGAKRLDVKDPGTTLTKIPVLPISYSDALPLLRALDGPVAPASWRGALPITYHLGPGKASVHLALEFDFNTVPAYDVIARLRGSEFPDEWIIRGIMMLGSMELKIRSVE